jgi:nucleoside-diphosphate-sugar epimerase
MRLLVLGGTRFVGRAIAGAAVGRGWQVTTFNRGQAGPDVRGVQPLRGDRTDQDDLRRLASAGRWDAVVDTSGYVPVNTLQVARSLQAVAGQYVFMSTVSAYRGWPIEPLSEASRVLLCPPDAEAGFGEDTEDGPTRYGYQKAGCEAAVAEIFGPDRSVMLRPGVVLGPGEYVGRLPWWLHRVATGGRLLAPGYPARTIQPVDVRDLADFTVRTVEDQLTGAFNVTAPIGRETFGGLLEACVQATGSHPDVVWVPDDVLLMRGVRQWSEIPLWRTFPGVWHVESTRAQSAGLRCRSLADTARDTWAWMRDGQVHLDAERSGEIGLSPEREQAILADVA